MMNAPDPYDWQPIDPNPPDEPPPAYVMNPAGPYLAGATAGPGYYPPTWGVAGYGYPVPPGGYQGHHAMLQQRPGTVVGAAVIGWIMGGLLLIAGLLLLLGASAVHDLSDGFGATNTSLTADFLVSAVLNFVSAGLLIAGAIGITTRRSNGRPLLAFGAAVCFFASIDWLTKGTDAVFWVILFDAPLVIALCLAWAKAASYWLASATQPTPYRNTW